MTDLAPRITPGAVPGPMPGGRIEDGVSLSAYTCEITDYLQHVFDLMETGDEDRIMGDPWFQRAEGLPALTDEDVDRVIEALDSEFETEIRHYASYHLNHSGANFTPDFHRLSPRARRAVVEGLDAIIARHKPEPPPATWA